MPFLEIFLNESKFFEYPIASLYIAWRWWYFWHIIHIIHANFILITNSMTNWLHMLQYINSSWGRVGRWNLACYFSRLTGNVLGDENSGTNCTQKNPELIDETIVLSQNNGTENSVLFSRLIVKTHEWLH